MLSNDLSKTPIVPVDDGSLNTNPISTPEEVNCPWLVHVVFSRVDKDLGMAMIKVAYYGDQEFPVIISDLPISISHDLKVGSRCRAYTNLGMNGASVIFKNYSPPLALK